MNTSQTAWAIQRPNNIIITSMIRPTRREAIDALRDHLIEEQIADAWPIAYRRGFRVIRIALLVLHPKPPGDASLTTHYRL